MSFESSIDPDFVTCASTFGTNEDVDDPIIISSDPVIISSDPVIISSYPILISSDPVLEPTCTYEPRTISSLTADSNNIRITGRVAGLLTRDPPTPYIALKTVKLVLSDGTAAIQVLIKHSPSSPGAQYILGSLVTVYATAVTALQEIPGAASTTIGCYIDVSDRVAGSRAELEDETEESIESCRVPLSTEDIMPLREFMESKGIEGANLLVSVKLKLPIKEVPIKDGTTLQKRSIRVFDASGEATLDVWTALFPSIAPWQTANTILLITAPQYGKLKHTEYIHLTHSSMVEINPSLHDARVLRGMATRLVGTPEMGLPFPEDKFDWNGEVFGEEDAELTLGEMERYARDPNAYLPECRGTVRVTITEMNAGALHLKRCLFTGSCCGFLRHSNTSSNIVCQSCNREIDNMLPNPKIFGCLSDETGSIEGGRILWSRRAWEDFFCVPIGMIPAKKRDCDRIDASWLFGRLTLILGWSAEVGRLAVREIAGHE